MGRLHLAFIRFSNEAMVKMCIIWSIHIFISVDSSEHSLKCIILKQIAYGVMFMKKTVLGSINLQGNMVVDISFKCEVVLKLCRCLKEK